MDKYNFSVGKIAAVIVTYNRLEKLKKALYYYENQRYKPDYMVIVDNASTDGTANWLEEWRNSRHEYQVDVIRTDKNLGGSGGFYLGEKRAMELPVDWIMLSDDDAYLAEDYIQGLVQYIEKHKGDNISAICGAVEQNGSYCSNQRRLYKKIKWQLEFLYNVPAGDYKGKVIYIDNASYLGIMINKKKLTQVGLVDKDFFIWWDDTEHLMRLRNAGSIICIPNCVIKHDVELSNSGLSWKSYYGARNKLISHKRHFPMIFPIIVVYFTVKTLLCPLKGRSFKEVLLRLTAVKDALMGNMGMNDVYKPGWKP